MAAAHLFSQVHLESFWTKQYLQLHPWTFLNGSIHRPTNGARPFDLAADVTTVRWTRTTGTHWHPLASAAAAA